MGRINRSVKLLDKYAGKKWPFKVKLGELDLSHIDRCILGQLYNGWDTAIDIFKKQADVTDTQRYAFDIRRTDTNAELTEKWRTRIKKLRKERKK
jgi:hypothetical protein